MKAVYLKLFIRMEQRIVQSAVQILLVRTEGGVLRRKMTTTASARMDSLERIVKEVSFIFLYSCLFVCLFVCLQYNTIKIQTRILLW